MSLHLIMACFRKLQDYHFSCPKRVTSLHNTHEEHVGITKGQLTARILIYWPGINEDIKDYIKQCLMGIMLSAMLPAEPLINYYIPQGPWQKIVQILWIWMTESTYSFFLQGSLPCTMSSATTNAVIGHLTDYLSSNKIPLKFHQK